jgi:hypothetical protein
MFTPEILITDVEAIFFLFFVGLTAWFSYRKGERDSVNDHVNMTVNSLIEQGYIFAEGEEMFKVQEVVDAELSDFAKKIDSHLPKKS